MQVFGRRCLVASDGSEVAATSIRVGSNDEESCICTVVEGTSSRIDCTYIRVECPSIQNFVIN